MATKEELEKLRRLKALAEKSGDALQVGSGGFFGNPVKYIQSLPKPEEKTWGERIAGSSGAGLLYGASKPFVGAFQLGAGVGDWISEKTGRKPTLGSKIASTLSRFEETRDRGRTGGGLDAPVLGGEFVTGAKLFSKLPVLKAWWARALQGGAAGGAMGAIQPVANEQPYLPQKAAQVATGAAAGTALPLIASGAGAVRSRFTEAGRQQAAGRLANEAAGDRQGAVVQQLRQNQNPLAQGTAGEVAAPAGSAEFSALQKAASQVRPSEYEAIRRAQDAARLAAVKSVGKTPVELGAAQRARGAATEPLYSAARDSKSLADVRRTVNLIDRIIKKDPKREAITGTLGKVKESLFQHYPVQQRATDAWQNTNKAISRELAKSGREPAVLIRARKILNQVKAGDLDEDSAIRQLSKLKSNKGSVNSALEFAKQSLRTPEWVVEENVPTLISASRNIQDLMNAKGPTGAKVNDAIVRELGIVKKSLDRQIAKVAPEYQAAQKLYAQMSKPIDQMRIGQYLEDKLVPALNDQGATAAQRGAVLAQALRDAPKTVKAATGFKRQPEIGGILDRGQMDTISKVGQDLARKADFEALAKAGTQRAGRITGEAFSERIPNALQHAIMIANAILRRTGAKANERTMDALARKMQDPQAMADLMEKATRAEQREIERAFMAFFTQQASQESADTTDAFLQANQ